MQDPFLKMLEEEGQEGAARVASRNHRLLRPGLKPREQSRRWHHGLRRRRA